MLANHYNDIKCINAYYEKFVVEKNSTMLPTQLKATISAAYFLIKNRIWNQS